LTKIYPVVCYLYSRLCTNFGSRISIFVRTATMFVTVTTEF